MAHSKKIMKNSIYSLSYKLLTIFLSFLIRKLFIEFMGVELLGLNSLFADLLSLLNLADMGLGMALQYNLYKPLADKDNKKISSLLNAAKKIYNAVGISIIFAGCIMCCFIQYLIKDNPYSLDFLRIVFLINVVSNASTYFFVHKRLFMQTVEDIYLTNIVDGIVCILSSIAKLVVIIFMKNYYVYVGIGVIQTIVSNVIVNYMCNKKYSYLSNSKKYNSEDMKLLICNLKELIPNRVGFFIFNNTDSTIISAIMGLTMVTYYTNYFTITYQIFWIAVIIANVVKVSFGNVMQEDEESERHISLLESYQFLQFLFSSVCGVLLICLLDDFVSVWYGREFVLSLPFVIILTLDFFVHSMYQPLSIMVEVIGEFKVLKNQQLICMVLNILLSIGLIFPFGLIGPIIGTIVVDIITFCFRIHTVIYTHYNKYFKEYINKIIKYIVVFIGQYILIYNFSKCIEIGNEYINIFIKAIVVGSITLLLDVLLFYKTEEYQYIKDRLKL